MGKKVFIARDESGGCFILSKKPVFRNGSYFSNGGSVARLHPIVATILGIPFPKPGEMIELPPPAQTASSKPEDETLVPITSLDQLRVGDRVRNNAGDDHLVLALAGEIVALSYEGEPGMFDNWWTIAGLKEMGYQQVVTAQRTLSREEARKAIDEGKTVKSVGGRITYKLSGDKMRIEATEGSSPVSIAVHVEMFDIPEGRYEIVGGE